MLADFAVPIRPCVRIAEIHSERHRAPPNGDSYKSQIAPIRFTRSSPEPNRRGIFEST